MTPILAVLCLAAAPQATAAATEDLSARLQQAEMQLLSAVQKKDVAAVGPQLTEDFGYVLAVSNKTPLVMNRGEFLKSVESHFKLDSFELRNLSVRAFGNTLVVNLGLLRKLSVGARDRSGEFSIVDVWVKEGNELKLAARYASRPDPGQ